MSRSSSRSTKPSGGDLATTAYWATHWPPPPDSALLYKRRCGDVVRSAFTTLVYQGGEVVLRQHALPHQGLRDGDQFVSMLAETPQCLLERDVQHASQPGQQWRVLCEQSRHGVCGERSKPN